jgi:hypothetical protein
MTISNIDFLYNIINYIHVLITGIIILAFLSNFYFRKNILYLICSIFLLQQIYFNGCFFINIQNELGQPLGKEMIKNQFLFGFFEGDSLIYFKLIFGILALLYLSPIFFPKVRKTDKQNQLIM